MERMNLENLFACLFLILTFPVFTRRPFSKMQITHWERYVLNQKTRLILLCFWQFCVYVTRELIDHGIWSLSGPINFHLQYKLSICAAIHSNNGKFWITNVILGTHVIYCYELVFIHIIWCTWLYYCVAGHTIENTVYSDATVDCGKYRGIVNFQQGRGIQWTIWTCCHIGFNYI